MKTSAHLGTRRRSEPHWKLQQLEPREIPAGLVTAVQSSGLLAIAGLDDLSPAGVTGGLNDQEILIAGTGAGSFDVSVVNGTQFQGTAATTLSFSGVTAIKLDMRQGNDIVTVNNANLSGDLSFLGGNGNDSLVIGGAAGNQSFGSVTIKNGDGDDNFSIGNGNNAIVGKLNIDNGVGNSVVTLNTQAADQLSIGDVIIKNTDGLDTLTAGGAKFSANTFTVTNGNGGSITNLASTTIGIAKDFKLANAFGIDQMTLGVGGGSFTVGKGVTIANSSGGSSVAFAGTTAIANAGSANLTITNLNGQDTTTFEALSVGNAISRFTGNVTIDNGSGGGTVAFNGKATINGNVSVKNSTGVNAISATGSDFRVTGSVSINNGAGGSTTNLAPLVR